MVKFVISGIAGAMLVLVMMGRIEGTVYTVGESAGWSMGSDYSSWAQAKTFAVGDTLVFNYGSGHTVDEVSASDYKSCSSSNATSTDSSGATSVTLKTAGSHYFICGIPGHCSGGMKLAVTAAAASPGGSSSASPPSTTTTTPASTSPGPPNSTVTGTTHTQPSSAAALSPCVAAFLTLLFVMFKCFA